MKISQWERGNFFSYYEIIIIVIIIIIIILVSSRKEILRFKFWFRWLLDI